MLLSKLINNGTLHQPFSVANKVRVTNIIGLITVGISALYSLNYLLILDEPLVALINSCFTVAYFLTLVFIREQHFRIGKLWFFGVLIFHLWVCTNIYVTNKTGFHLYYFLVPTGAFLLFELNENREKITLTFIALIMFFYCENTINTSPLIELDDQMNHLLYQSVVFFNMIEVVFVLTVFTNQIQQNELKLTQQATTDALTGIANRHYFFEVGERLIEIAHYTRQPFSVVLLDLDDFKAINDLHGHFMGDSCLIEVCQVVKKHCREEDLFARIGGEEFIIAMPNTTLYEAETVAEKIRLAIANHIISIDDSTEFSCTASIGIASKLTDTDKLQELLIDADKALYFAKGKGKNLVHLYDKELELATAV